MRKRTLLPFVFVVAACIHAQQPAAPEPEPQSAHGVVIFHRSTDEDQVAKASPATPAEKTIITPTDAERLAILIESYGLDVHLVPDSSHLSARAQFAVRNTGTAPLTHLALEISSSLRWESVSLRSSGSFRPLDFGQHLIDTRLDHTGQASEAILTLPEALAPGATADLAALYSGEISASTRRFESLGVSAKDAAFADWDAITPGFTGLRGFGNVLWYPVASAPFTFSHEGQSRSPLGAALRRQSDAAIRLHLTVEYTGEPPAAAYFCGRREVFHVLPETPDAPTEDGTGIATADFAARRIGFRFPSLFVVAADTSTTDNMLIAAVTAHPEVLPSYNAGSELVRPLLNEWLGENPLEPLTVIDHEGQPFQDGALVVVPMQANDAGVLAPALAYSLTHAWFRSSLRWLNEGVPQFMALLWSEQNQGRDAALAQLNAQVRDLALAEPQFTAPDSSGTGNEAGQSLIDAHDEVYYRTKSAAVLWMLRSMVGDAALKHTLALYRDTVLHNPKDEDAHTFQRLLEQAAHRDLGWFFEDWVYRDRGLADLSIVSVTPRDLSTAARTSWLVAAEIRNDGAAAVEVPITVRSGKLTKTEFLRLDGHSTASTRIIFEGVPAEVQVNDGTIPELTTSVHIRSLVSGTPDQ